MMSAEEFYDTYIEPGLNTYLNRYFVGVCMEYLWLLNLTGKLPLHIKKMGTWIGKTGNIDIIAQNEVRENLVGLCNWEKPQVTMEMCEELFANMKKQRSVRIIISCFLRAHLNRQLLKWQNRISVLF